MSLQDSTTDSVQENGYDPPIGGNFDREVMDMGILETRVDTLMRLCTAQTREDRARLQERLRRLMAPECRATDGPEEMIRALLLELGAPDHLTGHPYVIEAVLLMVEDRSYIRNITFGLYPQVAAHFDTTAGRVERAIRHLIEVTWTRGDYAVLETYFGNTVSPSKGKPTNSEFIVRLANVVRQRLAERGAGREA